MGRITIVIIHRPNFKLCRKVVVGKKESRGVKFDCFEKTEGKKEIRRKFCPIAVIGNLIKVRKKIKLLLKYLVVKYTIKKVLKGLYLKGKILDISVSNKTFAFLNILF